MHSEKLPNHDHYYHTHSEFFHHSLDLVHAFLMKDYQIGMHEQEFYEINIITKGTGIHYINGSPVHANVGDVFIILPNTGHGYVGGKNFDVFHVILSDGFVNKFIADLQRLPSFFTLFGAEPLMRGKTSSPLHLTLANEAFDDALRILSDIARYKNFDDTAECLIRSNLAMVAISLLCNAYSRENAQGVSYLSEDHAIMESISFIHERYYQKITIEDLTRIAHISRSAYIRKFKEICKMTPSAYIMKIRIESAAVMLTSTELSIAEIADRTGFYDTSHFSKAFASAYALSPIAYKNSKTR